MTFRLLCIHREIHRRIFRTECKEEIRRKSAAVAMDAGTVRDSTAKETPHKTDFQTVARIV